MKDKHDKHTQKMLFDNFHIPVKLSQDELNNLLLSVSIEMAVYPDIRFGQAFCNVYSETHKGLIFPELYYCKDELRTYRLLQRFLQGEN